MMLRIVIVEDSPQSRDLSRKIITSSYTDIEIVGEFSSVNDAITGINELKPDILLLDVEIEGGTSFDILKELNYSQYKIVFISAHQKFALQAIKFSALDFILKPYSDIELIESIDKVRNIMDESDYRKKVSTLLSNIEEENKKIVLKTNKSIHIVKISEIIHIDADNYYSIVHFINNISVVISKTLKEFEQLLNTHNFIRVHQSHLINLDHVKSFDKRDNGGVLMSNGKNLPVSNRKKQIVFDILNDLSI